MTTIGSVEDYDKLRGLSAGEFDVVLVHQQKASTYSIPFSSPPNGAIFVWDVNADEDDDGGTILSPGSITPKGRWKRLFDDALSVKWFGAKGDMKEYYKIKGTQIKRHPLETNQARLQKMLGRMVVDIEEYVMNFFRDAHRDWRPISRSRENAQCGIPLVNAMGYKYATIIKN